MWQLWQFVLTVKLPWNREPVQAAYPDRWQLSQFVAATPGIPTYGMCVEGRPSAGGNAPLWQVEH